MWYIYTMGYCSAIKKEHIWVSSNEVDEPRAYYTELSKSEKDGYCMLMQVYGIQKEGTDGPICRAAVEM